ncbi:hypothetical protein SNK03_013348 [Fusarium graminearum]
MSWLCGHGFLREKANDPLNIGINMFATGYHYMAAYFGYWSYANNICDNDVGHNINLMANASSDATIEDNCMCWCNAEGHGCSPIKLFLKTLFLNPNHGASKLHRILRNQSFNAPESDELSYLAKKALRLLTFEALDMTHTCCFFDEIYKHDPCNLVPRDIQYDRAIFCRDPHSIMEIRSRSEENRSAALLNDLMAEFIPQLQLFSPSHFAFEGFIDTYWRRRISQLYSADTMVVDDLRQHQAFQGLGVSSSSLTMMPEGVHYLLGENFHLLDPHETISDEECISEVSRYKGMQYEECGLFEKAECSISGVDCCESDQANSG